MADMITVKDLVEVYADGTKAVDGISFDVPEGEFFGFLGPNGAGKSTTIKVLTTLLKKTSGKVSVAGFDIDSSASEIRKVIGVQAQETVLDPDLTGRENLTLQCHLQQMHNDVIAGRVEELLKLIELDTVADRRAGNYSGGMKKRLDLASALVHNPKLLFLDEPTTGLDPQSRAKIWEYLERLNKEEKKTIFLTTQYMEEADKLCNDLYIMDHGKVIANGSPAELKRRVGADAITVSVVNGDSSDVKSKAKDVLTGIKGVTKVVEADGGLTAYAPDASSLVAQVVRVFDDNSIGLSSINLSRPSLDDVFLEHTGRRIRVEEATSKSGSIGRWGARRQARE